MARRRIAIPGAVIFRLQSELLAADKAGVASTRENVDRLQAIDDLYTRVVALQRHARAAGVRAAMVEALGLADENLLAVEVNHPKIAEFLLRCELEVRKAIEAGLQHLAEPTLKARLNLLKAKRTNDPVRHAAKLMKKMGLDRAEARARLTERWPDRPTQRTISNILNGAGFPARTETARSRTAEKTISYRRQKRTKKPLGKNQF